MSDSQFCIPKSYFLEFFANSYQPKVSLDDCFGILIKDVDPKVLSSLLNDDDNTRLLANAIKLITNGNNLGEDYIPNTTINSSGWISHSIYVMLCAEKIAQYLGLNEEEINELKKMAILHDVGRKITHLFSHIIEGYKYLIDNKLPIHIARAALLHSFFDGKRCNNCEPAIVTENIDKYDDVAVILSQYQYTMLDKILCLSDLMATDKGIVPVHERIISIYERRKTAYNVSNEEFNNKFSNRFDFEIAISKFLIKICDKCSNNNTFQENSKKFYNIIFV